MLSSNLDQLTLTSPHSDGLARTRLTRPLPSSSQVQSSRLPTATSPRLLRHSFYMGISVCGRYFNVHSKKLPPRFPNRHLNCTFWGILERGCFSKQVIPQVWDITKRRTPATGNSTAWSMIDELDLSAKQQAAMFACLMVGVRHYLGLPV